MERYKLNPKKEALLGGVLGVGIVALRLLFKKDMGIEQAISLPLMSAATFYGLSELSNRFDRVEDYYQNNRGRIEPYVERVRNWSRV